MRPRRKADDPASGTQGQTHERPALASWTLGFLLLVALASSGCTPIKLKALERYSSACKRQLTPRFERYVELFQQSGKTKDRKALQAQLSRRVLPALDAYVTALQQINPKPPKLRQIHADLTTAYTRWQGQLTSFAKGLTSDAAWVQQAAKLPAQIATLALAEKTYLAAIKDYARPPKRRR